MSHFAKIENGIVTQVVVAEQDVIDSGLFGDPASWVQTSYNTFGGVHLGPDGEPDGGVAIRKNYAGFGYTYDAELDAFYAPQPYSSWILDQETCLWEAPVAYPNNGKQYLWDEDTISWKEFS